MAGERGGQEGGGSDCVVRCRLARHIGWLPSTQGGGVLNIPLGEGRQLSSLSISIYDLSIYADGRLRSPPPPPPPLPYPYPPAATIQYARSERWSAFRPSEANRTRHVFRFTSNVEECLNYADVTDFASVRKMKRQSEVGK